jgi:hypothetical protein
MKIRFLLQASLAVALLADSSGAAAYRFLGAGTVSCEAWTAARQHRTGWYDLAEWVLGFLSGVGYAGEPGRTDPLQELDAHAVAAWVDNYCRAYPLKNLDAAAEAFVKFGGHFPLTAPRH